MQLNIKINVSNVCVLRFNISINVFVNGSSYYRVIVTGRVYAKILVL